MTVSAQTPYSSQAANGVTTAFPFAYKVRKNTDIVVVLVDSSGNETVQTLGVNYTVSGVGSPTGGTVNFLAAPANGLTVKTYRATGLERSIDYQSNGDLLAAVLNGDVDAVWLTLQELVSGTQSPRNSLRGPAGEANTQLVAAASRKDRLLAFDAGTGQPGMSPFTVTQVASAIAAAYLGGAASTLDALAFVQSGAGAVPRTAQDKMREWVSVTDFAANGVSGAKVDPTGVVDSTSGIQAAITYSATTGKALYVPPGTYLCGNISIPTADRLTIFGLGYPVIRAKAGSVGFLWNHSPAAVGAAAAVTANIVAGDTTFAVSPPVGAAVGDLIQITSTAVVAGGATRGILARVKALTGASVTVDSPAEYDISTADTPSATFFHPQVSPCIEGITFDLITNSHQSALQLQYTTNARVHDCKAYGGGSCDVGFSVSGIGGRVTNVVAENFDDATLTLGYGVSVSGHDMQVLNGRFKGCKHAVAGGSNQYLNTDLIYEGNVCSDPFGVALDAHASCTRVVMRGNHVLDVGLTSANGGAFNLRNSAMTVTKNVVRGATGVSIAGAIVQVIEAASDRIVVTDNDFQGKFGYFVKGNTSASLAYTNIVVSGNTMDAQGANCNGVFFNGTKVTTATLTNNRFINTVHSWNFGSLENAICKGNYIEIGNLGIGFQANGDVSKTWRNVVITDNVFKPIHAAAGSCVRGFGQAEDWVVANNVQDTSVASKQLFVNSATAGFLTRVASRVSPDGKITATGTAPPTAGTWGQGDEMESRSAAVGAVSRWRCTVGGTPGTWRAVEWITAKNTTANRPALTANDTGVNYLDTTLDPDGKPIWWNGTAWVDATGLVV